eukprot:CAMPEP_0184696848 /NCGR_PEP_ID=MMETSP0313-20130426/4014_1 /TAXON_ID=2792 /ORGANISM="Porphyridium aerugineum, Strain SAG 1380-2" /LENGTH=589 /DNA_ID=CAMNT_0027155563 /DNA_START=138 /DNA_END=1907 /DNA_ORIENTATION=-
MEEQSRRHTPFFYKTRRKHGRISVLPAITIQFLLGCAILFPHLQPIQATNILKPYENTNQYQYQYQYHEILATENNHPHYTRKTQSVVDDIQSLSESEIHQLKLQMQAEEVLLERDIESLNKEIEDLKSTHSVLDESDKTLLTTQGENSERRKVIEAELMAAKRSMEENEEKMKAMVTQLERLGAEVASMEFELGNQENKTEKTRSLSMEAQEVSLKSWVKVTASQISGVKSAAMRSIMRLLIPSMDSVLDQVDMLQREMAHVPGPLIFIVQLVMYSFFAFSVYYSFFAIRKLRSKFLLNINKLIVVGDICSAVFWLLVLACYVMLGMVDPFQALASSSNTRLFLLFQLSWLWWYIAYVMLRVVNASKVMEMGAVGEVISVIIVGHHHYVESWAPLMTGTYNIHRHSKLRRLFFYVCYAWLFCAYSFFRIHTMVNKKRDDADGDSMDSNSKKSTKKKKYHEITVLEWLYMAHDRLTTLSEIISPGDRKKDKMDENTNPTSNLKSDARSSVFSRVTGSFLFFRSGAGSSTERASDTHDDDDDDDSDDYTDTSGSETEYVTAESEDGLGSSSYSESSDGSESESLMSYRRR